MNYKQMVLLEDLVNQFNADKHYKLSFILENKLCTGDFRKRNPKVATANRSLVRTEKLFQDFLTYMMEDEVNRNSGRALFFHLLSDVANKKEKFDNYFFNTMVVFLTEEIDVADYLIGYDGPEIIYHFYTYNGYQEEFLLDGREVEPLSMYEMQSEEAL